MEITFHSLFLWNSPSEFRQPTNHASRQLEHLGNRHARHQLSVESRSDQLYLIKAVLAHGKDVNGIRFFDDCLALQGQGVGLVPVQITQKDALLHPEQAVSLTELRYLKSCVCKIMEREDLSQIGPLYSE
jgi:hypothetical protein